MLTPNKSPLNEDDIESEELGTSEVQDEEDLELDDDEEEEDEEDDEEDDD